MLKRFLNRNRALRPERSSAEKESEVDVTPMLDVIFILLIFFVISASFVGESGVNLNRPPDHSENFVYCGPSHIVVEIDKFNQIRIQNVSVFNTTIRRTIIRLRAESPDAAVAVRLHAESTTAALIAAIDGIKSANVDYSSVAIIRG